MGEPAAITIGQVSSYARGLGMTDLACDLEDRKNRRAVPHMFERVGYLPARNPNSEDGLFKVNGKRVVVYAARRLPDVERFRAARAVS